MPKTIATIEIAIEQQGVPSVIVKASLQVKEGTCYTVSVSKPSGQLETTALDCVSQGPAVAWLVQRLKRLVDEFGPSSATITVVEDTLNVLPKITYRCANHRCRAKLFESWGSAEGIRIVCRKCKTLGIPVPEENE
jgi:hypothetical protein